MRLVKIRRCKMEKKRRQETKWYNYDILIGQPRKTFNYSNEAEIPTSASIFCRFSIIDSKNKCLIHAQEFGVEVSHTGKKIIIGSRVGSMAIANVIVDTNDILYEKVLNHLSKLILANLRR